jgi:peptide-methionine (S)-S-oxide reductase
VGTQYRSLVLYTSPEQKKSVDQMIAQLNQDQPEPPIITDVNPFSEFFPAEEYHHEYFKKNPDKAYCQMVINPKLRKVREEFAALLKK